MKLQVAIAALLSACCASAGAVDMTGDNPPDGTHGLLEVPALFGSGDCTQRSGGKYVLRNAPAATATSIASLEADPLPAGQNACSQDALIPRVRKPGEAWTSPVPTREFKAEHPGLVVIDTRPGWDEILIGDDTAWLQTPPGASERRYGDIVLLAAVRTLRGWDGRVCTHASEDTCRKMAMPANPALRIDRIQMFGSEMWIEVEFGISACEGATVPGRDVLVGWIPAYGAPGNNGRRPLTLWLNPRGC